MCFVNSGLPWTHPTYRVGVNIAKICKDTALEANSQNEWWHYPLDPLKPPTAQVLPLLSNGLSTDISTDKWQPSLLSFAGGWAEREYIVSNHLQCVQMPQSSRSFGELANHQETLRLSIHLTRNTRTESISSSWPAGSLSATPEPHICCNSCCAGNVGPTLWGPTPGSPTGTSW